MFADVHHHLLWGVDDGPKTFEETQQMIYEMVQEDVQYVIATAHATPGRVRFPAETYFEHLRQAQQWCAANGLEVMIYPGSEIFYTSNTARLLREGQIPTLAQGRWVLVEFSPEAPYERLKEAARTLGMAGYNVLFAHVERYRCLRNLKRMAELHDNYDVTMQMNASTVLAKKRFWEKGRFRKIITSGWIDMIATDAHNTTTRRCCMAECYEALKQEYGWETAEELCVEGPKLVWN